MNLYTHTFHSVHRIVYDHCEDSRHLRLIHYHKNSDKAILYVHMIFLFRIIQSTFQKSCLSYEFFANDSPPFDIIRIFLHHSLAQTHLCFPATLHFVRLNQYQSYFRYINICCRLTPQVSNPYFQALLHR